jgi:hypothetical protein
MKNANVKGTVAKAMLAGVVAGALMMAAPAKAQAQEVVIGARFGRPIYGPPDRFAIERREEFLRREAFLRHQEWERAHRFGHPYGFYR